MRGRKRHRKKRIRKFFAVLSRAPQGHTRMRYPVRNILRHLACDGRKYAPPGYRFGRSSGAFMAIHLPSDGFTLSIKNR